MAPTNDTALRARLSESRQHYIDDMRWLKTRFGIIPDLKPEWLKPALWNGLNALESGNAEDLSAAIKAFERLHRSTMKDVVWQLLESSKRALKTIKESHPELYEQKLSSWNEASCLFTNFNVDRKQPIGTQYRKALEVLAAI